MTGSVYKPTLSEHAFMLVTKERKDLLYENVFFIRSYLQKSNNLADQFSNVFKEENALRISFNVRPIFISE